MRFHFEQRLSCGALPLCERDASQLIFWVDRLRLLYPVPALYPLFSLSGGATIFVWDLERWKSRHKLRCQSNVFRLSDWTASSSAICLLSSSVGAVWSDRETPLETQGSSTAGRLDGFSSQTSSPERKRFAHTVWLQSWCLCYVSINVSENYLSF